MKRITKLLLVGSTIAMLAALTAAPVAAGSQVERPFQSTDSGFSVEDEGACDLTGFPVIACPTESSATGHATHLGKTSSETEGILTVDLTDICFLPDGSLGINFLQEATFVTTAANGDEVHGDFVTTGCASLVDPTAAVGYTGAVTVTGGTGRFAGATGSVTTTGVSVPVTSEVSAFEQTSTGTITY